MKRAIAVMLILLCLLSLFSCDTPDNQDELPDETLPQTEAQTEAEPKYTYIDYGLNDTFDFVPKSDDDRIKEGNYVKVSDISSDYVRTESDGKIFLKYNTPQMELAGIKDPSENNGEFYRLDAKNKSKYYNLHQNSVYLQK